MTALLQFCRAYAAALFAGWADGTLAAYLEHHIRCGQLAVLTRAGLVEALAVGWKLDAGDAASAGFRADTWSKRVENPAGTVFYVDLLIAPRRAAIAPLLEEFRRRYPAWESLTTLWNRRRTGHKKWVQLPAPDFVRRLTTLAGVHPQPIAPCSIASS